jgi:hypothetical protein
MFRCISPCVINLSTRSSLVAIFTFLKPPCTHRTEGRTRVRLNVRPNTSPVPYLPLQMNPENLNLLVDSKSEPSKKMYSCSKFQTSLKTQSYSNTEPCQRMQSYSNVEPYQKMQSSSKVEPYQKMGELFKRWALPEDAELFKRWTLPEDTAIQKLNLTRRCRIILKFNLPRRCWAIQNINSHSACRANRNFKSHKELYCTFIAFSWPTMWWYRITHFKLFSKIFKSPKLKLTINVHYNLVKAPNEFLRKPPTVTEEYD